MRFPLLQPRWLGLHVVAVLAVVSCFVFGYWQFVRAQEPSRDAITNPVEDPSAAVELRTVLAPGEYMPQDRANTAVTATGEYDPGAGLLVPARSPEGDEGYNAIAPLVTEDGTAVVVHRGWVDGDEADAPEDLAPLPDGEVTVTGWLLPPQTEEEGFIPVSMPEGQVERIAPSILMNDWEYRLYEGYVLLAAQEPDPQAGGSGVQPRDVPPPEPPREIEWNWRSVSYAAQWVVFGVAALVFWVVLMRRELAGQADGSGGAEGPAGSGESGGAPEPPGGAPGAGAHSSATGTSSSA